MRQAQTVRVLADEALATLQLGDPSKLIAFHRSRFGDLRMEETEAERTAREAAEAAARARPTPPGVPAGFVSQEAHQAELSRIATAEKAQGERAGRRALIESLGLDPETAKPEEIRAILEAAAADRQARETEAETKAREATEKQTAAELATQAAQADRLASRIELQLVMAGMTPPKDDASDDDRTAYSARLADARKLIEATPDASDQALRDAVVGLKTRIPALFDAAVSTPLANLPDGGPPGTPPRQQPEGDAYARGQARARGGSNGDQQRQPVATSNMFG